MFANRNILTLRLVTSTLFLGTAQNIDGYFPNSENNIGIRFCISYYASLQYVHAHQQSSVQCALLYLHFHYIIIPEFVHTFEKLYTKMLLILHIYNMRRNFYSKNCTRLSKYIILTL